MKALIGYLRYAIRMTVENSGFILMAALALALSLGVNFAISGRGNKMILHSSVSKATKTNRTGVQTAELSIDSDYRFLFGCGNISCIILTQLRPGAAIS